MSTVVTNGYSIFTDVDGTPLEEGYIFIGQPNLNPVSNPKPAYWNAARTNVATAIRTSGGYPVYLGTPSRLYTDGPYSILVQNRDGEQVYLQLVSMAVGEDPAATPTNPDLAGGLPLGSILPKAGVTFTGFLDLGTAGLSAAAYPDLYASGCDYVIDNGDGTFDLLDSQEDTGWVSNATWANQGITITHSLLKNMTELDIQVFVSSAGTEATAIKVLDTAFDQAAPAAEFNGLALLGIGNASFKLLTGTDGLSVVNTDGTQIILVSQNWYYKVVSRRRDAPYPAQISYISLASSVDGGVSDARVVAVRIRRDTAANWATNNPVLLVGEGGYETDTEVLKIGDGSSLYNALNPVNTNITADITAVIGSDRTFLENDGGVLKVSLGSVIEADGTYYTVTGAAATPSGVATDGAYLFFDPIGGTYTWSTTPGTQNPAKGGIYDASSRRQCRYRLKSATEWDRVVSDGDDSIVEGDLEVEGTLNASGPVAVTGVFTTGDDAQIGGDLSVPFGDFSTKAITATTINTGQGANEAYGMDQNVKTSNSPTFAGLTLNGPLLPETSPVSGTQTMFSGNTWYPPRGVYEIDMSNALRIELFIGGSWVTSAQHQGVMAVISDGVNVRIDNPSASTYVVSWLKF